MFRTRLSVTTNHGTSLSMDCKYESYPSAKLPHKGVFNVSSLSTQEGSDGSSNTQEEMVVSDKSKKRERVCYKRTM